MRGALAPLNEALGRPDRDALSERVRHLVGVQHFATLAMACAADGDWPGVASNLRHALASERDLLGDAGPLRAALTRARTVAA